MNLEQREQDLLKLVADYREQECGRILAEAEQSARDLLRQTFARERAGLHQGILVERARAHSLIRAAAAERTTRARRRGERSDAALVAAAWPRLVAALKARWANAETRARWVDHALSEAERRLPCGAWLVRYAQGWPEDERETARGRIEALCGAGARFQADVHVSAGLLIAADGAELDLTLEGLLRDRRRVEARLLALAKGRLPETDGPADTGTGGAPRAPGDRGASA